MMTSSASGAQAPQLASHQIASAQEDLALLAALILMILLILILMKISFSTQFFFQLSFHRLLDAFASLE